MDALITQIAEALNAAFGPSGLKITDSADVLLVERSLLEFMTLL